MTDRPSGSDQTYRVVVADDVEDLRYLVTRALEGSGRFTVVGSAGTGREAIIAASQHRPDLTLLDLAMPDMDGLEALPHIRKAVPDSTVVVLSGFDAERMAGPAMAQGAAGYLVKGLSPAQLVADLVALLEGLDLPPGSATGQTGHGVSEEVDRALLDLPAELDSAARARAFLRDRLPSWKLDHLMDTAMLLTTELVTNAVVHARSPVHLAVGMSPARLRVEVADNGTGALAMREPTFTDPGGRGLLLIEALSTAWGTSSAEAGKLVWFELDVDQR